MRLRTHQQQVFAPGIKRGVVAGFARHSLDLGEETPLEVHVPRRRDPSDLVQERACFPPWQGKSLQFLLQVFVVGTGTTIQGEQQLQQEAHAVGRIEAGGQQVAVPGVLDGSVQ